MKTILAFLALVTAFIAAPSLATPAQAQPCQWQYAFVNNVATATYCGNVASTGQTITPNDPTYYGGASNPLALGLADAYATTNSLPLLLNGGNYILSTVTTLNAPQITCGNGTIQTGSNNLTIKGILSCPLSQRVFDLAGTGVIKITYPAGDKISVMWFGAKSDSTPSTNNRVTDSTNAFQRAINASNPDVSREIYVPAPSNTGSGTAYAANIVIGNVAPLHLRCENQYGIIMPADRTKPMILFQPTGGYIQQNMEVSNCFFQATGAEGSGIFANSVGMSMDMTNGAIWNSNFHDIRIDNVAQGFKTINGNTNWFHNVLTNVLITNTSSIGIGVDGGEYNTYINMWSTNAVAGFSVQNAGNCESAGVWINLTIDGKFYQCGANNNFVSLHQEGDVSICSQAAAGDACKLATIPVIESHGNGNTFTDLQINQYPTAFANDGFDIYDMQTIVDNFRLIGTPVPTNSIKLASGSTGIIRGGAATTGVKRIDQVSASADIANWIIEGDVSQIYHAAGWTPANPQVTLTINNGATFRTGANGWGYNVDVTWPATADATTATITGLPSAIKPASNYTVCPVNTSLGTPLALEMGTTNSTATLINPTTGASYTNANLSGKRVYGSCTVQGP